MRSKRPKHLTCTCSFDWVCAQGPCLVLQLQETCWPVGKHTVQGPHYNSDPGFSPQWLLLWKEHLTKVCHFSLRACVYACVCVRERERGWCSKHKAQVGTSVQTRQQMLAVEQQQSQQFMESFSFVFLQLHLCVCVWWACVGVCVWMWRNVVFYSRATEAECVQFICEKKHLP